MTFTEEEENILKLMVNEIKTRKKFDAERAALEQEFRDAWQPLRAEIEARHKEAMLTLEAQAFTASQTLEGVFK